MLCIAMIWKQLTDSTMALVHHISREMIRYICSSGDMQTLKVFVAGDNNPWA